MSTNSNKIHGRIFKNLMGDVDKKIQKRLEV